MNKALMILLLVGLLAGGVIGGILLGQYLDAASNTSEADQGITAVGTEGESGVEVELVRPMFNPTFCANCTRIRATPTLTGNH